MEGGTYLVHFTLYLQPRSPQSTPSQPTIEPDNPPQHLTADPTPTHYDNPPPFYLESGSSMCPISFPRVYKSKRKTSPRERFPRRDNPEIKISLVSDSLVYETCRCYVTITKLRLMMRESCKRNGKTKDQRFHEDIFFQKFLSSVASHRQT